MIEELARAKVNLALHVVGRRADGYHDLDSIVAFADLGDCLTLAPAAGFTLSVHGPFAAGLSHGEDNLALKAALTLAAAFPGKIAPARITLEKNLPLAAGLGGGSTDAAAVLRGLLRLSSFAPDPAAFQAIALSLGADVPVCLMPSAQRMRGVGDIVERLANFTPLHAVLINPGIASRTPDVFAALRLQPGAPAFQPISATMNLPRCRNDLEAPAKQLTPAIASILSLLRGQRGLAYARMTGSGATCFGIFEDAELAASAARKIKLAQPKWWCAATVLA